jgi:hypothetical protein
MGEPARADRPSRHPVGAHPIVYGLSPQRRSRPRPPGKARTNPTSGGGVLCIGEGHRSGCAAAAAPTALLVAAPCDFLPRAGACIESEATQAPTDAGARGSVNWALRTSSGPGLLPDPSCVPGPGGRGHVQEDLPLRLRRQLLGRPATRLLGHDWLLSTSPRRQPALGHFAVDSPRRSQTQTTLGRISWPPTRDPDHRDHVVALGTRNGEYAVSRGPQYRCGRACCS